MLRFASGLIAVVLLAAASQAGATGLARGNAGMHRFEGPAPVPDPISFPLQVRG